jgi:hypothetical protein
MRARPVQHLDPAARPASARAVRLRWNIEPLGLRVPRNRIVDVVDSLPPDQATAERDVLTTAEAEALVELGCADRVDTATIIRFPERW